VLKEMNVFFGPSKDFLKVFKYAVITNCNLKEKERFDMSDEPIFSQILSNMVLGQLQNLKHKARIKVRDSCVLIGVIDAEGILEEGEVFVQIDQRPYDLFETEGKELSNKQKKMRKVFTKEKSMILDGEVLVTKNPCNHPGDIRKLKAVGETDPRHSKLNHLFNVIVFPSKGYRPEQNKMSGGDLDGDVYMTIWDQKFV
jgi:RNA-dependent RNA polymerase